MIRRHIPNVSFNAVRTAVADVSYAHILSGGSKATRVWGGDWRMIVAQPTETFMVRDGGILVDGKKIASVKDVSPFAVLFDMLERRQLVAPRAYEGDHPSFLSGAVGYVSYEMARYLEPTLQLPGAATATMNFAFYDAVFANKLGEDEVFIFATTSEVADQLENFLVEQLDASKTSKISSVGEVSGIAFDKPNLDYLLEIRRCIDEILDGQIFQANLSRELSCEVKTPGTGQKVLSDGFDHLMTSSAAGFGAKLQYEDKAYLSNSPERFFSVRGGRNRRKVVAEPVKGTRPRYSDPTLDKAVADDLASSEKDRAENIMITDLVRNDLSKVCLDGTIQEEAICELVSWPHVHHLVSKISGDLLPDKSAVDVLTSSFPCGSVTGAPKVRAMEIIGALEKRPRGIYCGTIGFIDDCGLAEFSVTIRTIEAHKSRGRVDFRYGTGGGITVLSEPEHELEETEVKARTFSDFYQFLKRNSGNEL